MTNAVPPLPAIAGGVARRPPSLPLRGPAIPFGMASLASSAVPLSSRSLYALPNWTRLAGDDDAASDGAASDGAGEDDAAGAAAVAGAAPGNGVVAPLENGTVSNVTSEALETRGANDVASSAENLTDDYGLAPTYSTPREASAAYRSGLLKSDFNISSNHPSIRLAFRYLSADTDDNIVHVENDDAGGEEAEDLFLCWVRQDGVPLHFRRMRPVRANATPDVENSIEDDVSPAAGEEHGNLRGTSNGQRERPPSHRGGPASLLVNEHDHIETTFPGHAFVFCRRVEHARDGDDDASRNGDEPIVVNDDDGCTYFLRREGETEGEGEEELRTYLVVGGFRPGLMPDVTRDGNDEPENDGEVGAGDNEGSEEGKAEESDGDSSDDEGSDDDSLDGRECRVQLVTIRLVGRHHASNGAPPVRASNPNASNAETEIGGDVLLPSAAFGCSDCAQSVPCLRGAMNPRTRHMPAFVATKGNGDIELPHPPSADTENTERQTAAEEAAEGPALEVTVCMTQLDPTPIDTSSKHYDEVILGGWPCRTEPGCFPSDMDVPETGRNLLRCRFESDLAAAAASLPPAARERLRDSTPVWINKSQSFGPRAAPVRGRDGCFHPGAGWLRRNGMNPAKCGGVEWYDARHYLSDCDLWGPGGLMLHELSHAWHCLHVPNGYDNADVKETYDRAMEDGLYDCVPVHGPQGPRCRAYACQDQMEFFAELSVAFLGGLDEREHNKWYPFNRAQLREHDPRAYAMLCRVWGVEDDTSREGPSPRQEDGGEASRES